MIEAMACGTPVIAFNNGSVPEVLENGLTGYIVGSEDEAVAALREVPKLSRDRVRAEFDRRFTAQHMAQNYLKLYARLSKMRAAANATESTFLKGASMAAQAAAMPVFS
jgi:glycosyltransferase involved in cell wall biosynthesis